MMLVTSIVTDSYVCQLVSRRFIESEISVLLERKRQMDGIVDAPMKPEGHFISFRRRARMQEAIKDVNEPWGALAALKEVEAQCAHVPTSALARGRTVFILVTSILLAMLLIDVDNCTSAQQSMNVGAAIATISFAFTLVLFTSIYNKCTVYVNDDKSSGGRSDIAGQMESGLGMCDIKSVSVGLLKNGSTKNSIMG